MHLCDAVCTATRHGQHGKLYVSAVNVSGRKHDPMAAPTRCPLALQRQSTQPGCSAERRRCRPYASTTHQLVKLAKPGPACLPSCLPACLAFRLPTPHGQLDTTMRLLQAADTSQQGVVIAVRYPLLPVKPVPRQLQAASGDGDMWHSQPGTHRQRCCTSTTARPCYSLLACLPAAPAMAAQAGQQAQHQMRPAHTPCLPCCTPHCPCTAPALPPITPASAGGVSNKQGCGRTAEHSGSHATNNTQLRV
jgi:hypothetical protein